MVRRFEREVREEYDGRTNPVIAARRIWDKRGGNFNKILRCVAAKYKGYDSWKDYEGSVEFWRQIELVPNEVLDRAILR
jgi:hypothetical protein